MFYYSYIESVITFSFVCWFHSINLQNRNCLDRTVKVCSKMIGLPIRTRSTVSEQQMLRLAVRIIEDPSCLVFCFWVDPSGCKNMMKTHHPIPHKCVSSLCNTDKNTKNPANTTGPPQNSTPNWRSLITGDNLELQTAAHTHAWSPHQGRVCVYVLASDL